MKNRLVAAAIFAAFGFADSAIAADMPTKAPMTAVATPFYWTGFYVGVNGGWARDTVGIDSPILVQPDKSGGTFGGQVGYNWQWSQFVLGAEVDGNWLGLKASTPCSNPLFTCTTEDNSQISARARLGYAFDRFLVYATGGGAWTTFKGSTAFTTTFPDSSSRTGWILGGGAEYAVTNNIILGAEWLHADFGSKDMTYDRLYPGVKVTTDQVRARFSYLFNWH